MGSVIFVNLTGHSLSLTKDGFQAKQISEARGLLGGLEMAKNRRKNDRPKGSGCFADWRRIRSGGIRSADKKVDRWEAVKNKKSVKTQKVNKKIIESFVLIDTFIETRFQPLIG